MKQKTRPSETAPATDRQLLREATKLARRSYPLRPGKRGLMVSRFLGLHAAAQGKDVLVIQSPGGWGNTPMDGLLDWERSLVTGLVASLEKLGYDVGATQYIRSGGARYAHFPDVLRDIRFFTTGASPRAVLAARELKLLLEHMPQLRVVLLGASQGAAFDNAVMQRVGEHPRLYSIEMGTFFPYMRRRSITDRTLAVDDNGLMRDPMVDRDLWAGTKAYAKGAWQWLKLIFKGKHMRFTHLTNTPGHEYHWDYPGVRPRVTAFLAARFGEKTGRETKT